VAGDVAARSVNTRAGIARIEGSLSDPRFLTRTVKRTRGPNVIDDRTRAQQIHGIWCASSLAPRVASRLLTPS
jgi:hypothetical protein